MKNYSFHFADSYLGFWNIPNIGRRIPGSLYVEQHSVRLELFWNNAVTVGLSYISSATGYAHTETDNKKVCFYFVLKGLKITSNSWFGRHQSKYKLDVNHFFMSDTPRFSTNGILNCCIRTSLMDKWVWDYTQGSYSNLWPFKENDTIELKYQSKPSMTLFESASYKLYLKFGYESQTPNASGFKMSTKSFLNLTLKKKQKFYDALDLTESVIWLFSLLWNNQFNPEFIEFRTGKTKFIYKQSDRYSYKYHDIVNNALATLLSGFEEEELFTIVTKWFDYIEDERPTISTFFETQFNEHTTPSTLIKNYMSVIDGLTRNQISPTSGQTSDSKRLKKFEPSFRKIKAVLTPKEFNEIKMAIIRESPTDLKPRFSHLIETLSGFVNIELDADFCIRAVETRNLITHPKSLNKDVFRKEQYRDVAYCLEDIIRARILYDLGLSKHLAKKIVNVISFHDK